VTYTPFGVVASGTSLFMASDLPMKRMECTDAQSALTVWASFRKSRPPPPPYKSPGGSGNLDRRPPGWGFYGWRLYAPEGRMQEKVVFPK
jgi:hypothetical protein